jgi:hypothetical protein
MLSPVSRLGLLSVFVFLRLDFYLTMGENNMEKRILVLVAIMLAMANCSTENETPDDMLPQKTEKEVCLDRLRELAGRTYLSTYHYTGDDFYYSYYINFQNAYFNPQVFSYHEIAGYYPYYYSEDNYNYYSNSEISCEQDNFTLMSSEKTQILSTKDVCNTCGDWSDISQKWQYGDTLKFTIIDVGKIKVEKITGPSFALAFLGDYTRVK